MVIEEVIVVLVAKAVRYVPHIDKNLSIKNIKQWRTTIFVLRMLAPNFLFMNKLRGDLARSLNKS